MVGARDVDHQHGRRDANGLVTVEVGFVVGRRDGVGDPVHEFFDHVDNLPLGRKKVPLSAAVVGCQG
jgi:hypothetical protein